MAFFNVSLRTEWLGEDGENSLLSSCVGTCQMGNEVVINKLEGESQRPAARRVANRGGSFASKIRSWADFKL
jgi:hypothetical protein